MAESIESLRHPTLEIQDIPIDSIELDKANPNEVPERVMEALRVAITEDGFLQPIVVRPLDKEGKYRMIDGEHRYLILRDAGVETVPAVIDDTTEDEGRMRLLTLNGLRGRPDPVRQAKVLSYLIDQLGEDEMRRRLGMEEDDMAAVLALAEIPEDLQDELEERLREEEEEAPEVLRFLMGPQQAKTTESALTTLVEDEGKRSRADALIHLLTGI